MLAVASRAAVARDAYAVPMAHMAAAWPDVLARTTLPPCPYRGLQAFTPADAEAGLFVGREEEVHRLRRMTNRHPLVAVVGASGVGKSSLVGAGLVPTLRADGWAVASFRPGPSPFDSLARAVLELERPNGGYSLRDLSEMADRLRTDGLWRVGTQLAVLLGRRVAFAADQLEEALLLDVADEHQAFLDKILPDSAETGDSDVRLICTLRVDFLPGLLELAGVGPRLQDRQLNLSPLDTLAMTRVIVEPATLSGVSYAAGLAETIARNASQGHGGLPLLEFTLTELWALQDERRLSFDSYHSLGGVAGALNRHAERVFSDLTERTDPSRVRRVLLSMVRSRSGAAAAVRVVARKEHIGPDWAIAEQLARPDYRLVVLGPDGPGTAELAHEALIRGWRRFGDWVDEDAEFQRWLATMEERAADGDLLSDTRVEEAQRWLGERGADVPGTVIQLIARSRSAVQNRIDELEAARLQSEVALREARELTDRLQKANRALEQQTQQLILASRYKDEFLANTSHELRTPLNSMLLLSRLLAEPLDKLADKHVEFARTIHNAGSDLLALIDDILDLSKIAAGRMDVQPSEASLADLSAYVEQAFRPQSELKALNFSVTVDADVPQVIVTDTQRVQQVLRNLMANAVKFTGTGAVGLKIGLAPAGAHFDAPSLVNSSRVLAFAVTDTGIGIAEDKLSLVFDAFRQADGTTSRKYGGTGLGLSISRDLAALLGGTITVASTPGRGSTFTLFLPETYVGPAVPARAATTDKPAPSPVGPAVPAGAATKDKPAPSPDGWNWTGISEDALSDVRTPLLSISLLARLLADDGDGRLTAKQAEFARVIRSAAMDALAMVDDLTDLLRIVVGQVNLQHRQIAWADVRVDTTRRFLPMAEAKGTAIAMELAQNAPQHVVADPHVLRLILNNLISSAISATTAGTVTVRVGVAQAGSHLDIPTLTDADRVFTVTVASAMSPQANVAAVAFGRALAAVLGGTVTADAVDSGSAFTLHLPDASTDWTGHDSPGEVSPTGTEPRRDVTAAPVLGDEHTAHTDGAPAADVPYDPRWRLGVDPTVAERLAGVTILVVDDDVRNVYALVNVLESLGMILMYADNGAAGVRLLTEYADIELVLMDAMMPEMDGYQATREIRRRGDFADLPIIFFTARALPEDRDRSLRAGATDYLTKPVDIGWLCHVMAYWLDRRHQPVGP
ncbi:hypothetical protein Vau01_106060 [Virgisporangium aurantiacum]|uniref:Circadian input-output histidine kinase CikA n=2 Tax=Virgisporangium aurantiacum TaxID=175570 RepID=A0A8J3ZJE8_9ACTN|nr:hypothetical protein Vau01_106060 [Virgisporangium aurantiacum]